MAHKVGVLNKIYN